MQVAWAVGGVAAFTFLRERKGFGLDEEICGGKIGS